MGGWRETLEEGGKGRVGEGDQDVGVSVGDGGSVSEADQDLVR